MDIDGTDFYDVLQELGEIVTFEYKQHKYYQKASIAPNRLNKAISKTEGSFFYTGNMTFDNMWQQEHFIGSYFKRESQPNSTLMLMSVFPEASTDKIGFVHVAECNEKVDVISHYEEQEIDGEMQRVPVYKAKDAWVYLESYMSGQRTMPTGLMDNGISYITLPASLMITPETIIMRSEVVFDEDTKESVVQKMPYQISDIDEGLMDIMDDEIVGVVKCLIKANPQI